MARDEVPVASGVGEGRHRLKHHSSSAVQLERACESGAHVEMTNVEFSMKGTYEGTIEDVGMARDPANVRNTGVHVAVLVVEHVAVGEAPARRISESTQSRPQ